MFAVLKTGGKQYKVQSGDVLRVEKLAADAGEKIQFNDVLMLGGDAPVIGTPFVAGAAVQAEVIDQIKGDKVINFVRRRRKHSSKRTVGHRQQLTLLRVTDILAKGGDKSGVKAAVGAGSVAGVAVAAKAAAKAAGKPAAKTAEPKKAESKKAEAAKAESKKAEPKKAEPKKADAAKASKAADAAAEATGTRPANLLTEARGGQPDDLKKISGVGPKLEELLHSNGVFHFDQIAAWNSDEIAYMDDQLSFKGRIERDDWQKQAAQFAAEKE